MYIEIMKNWELKYYKDIDNKCEVQEFIDKLNTNNQAKTLAWIDILKDEGPTLPRPFADFLRDGIHELRIKLSGNQIRIFYFFVFQNYIILTHSYVKKESKVPDKEINKALRIKNEFNKRFKNKNQFEKYLKENQDD